MSAEAETPGTGLEVAAKPALRRRYWSPAARMASLVPVYLLLVPFVRTLELFGRWPRAISKAGARMTRDFEGYEPGAHDVMVCSYFKSRTNWIMQIVTQIAHRGRAEFDHIHDVVPWVELPERVRYAVPASDASTWRNAPTGLRAVKTHLPFGKLVYSPSARYVWVVRDPKDVFVSGYRFVKSTVLGPLMPSVEKWLDLFLSDNAYLGSWAEHADSGWRRRHEANVLFLTYEQMKADLHGTVARIAEFMRVELAPDELESTVRRSSYAHMKAHGRQFDTRGLSPPWAAARGAMVRRGERGSAGELLSAADQRRIDDHFRVELAKLRSDFPYDEMYRRPAGR